MILRENVNVLMLVANAGTTDARVRKEAEALASAGFDVTVGCTKPKNTENEYLNNVYYHRAQLVRGVHFGFWVKILRQYLISDPVVKFWMFVFFLIATVISTVMIWLGYLLINTVLSTMPLWKTEYIAAAITTIFTAWVGLKILTHQYLFANRYNRFRNQMKKKRNKFVKKKKRAAKNFLRARFKILNTIINYGSISFRLVLSINQQGRIYDVIHAHDLNTLIAGAILSKRHNAKLVFDAHELASHEDDLHRIFGRAFKRIIMRSFIPKTDQVITVSQGIARHFREKHNLEHVEVIYNTPQFKPETEYNHTVRGDAKLDKDEVLIVYIGGINRRRGSSQLGEALRYLPDHYNFILVTGAKNDVRNDIIKRGTLKLKAGFGAKIKFMPPVPASEVVHYFRDADVSVITRIPPKFYFNPQREYSMPNKLFESLFSGLPVVVGASQEVTEFTVGNNMGLPADCRKPKQLAQRIIDVYENRNTYQKSKAEISSMKEKYGWQSQALKLTEVYDRLLEIQY